MSKLTDTFSAAGYVAGWKLVKLLPESTATALFRRGADWTTRPAKAKRPGQVGPAQLRRNLARVIGTTPEAVPDELMRAAVRSYARYWKEAFRLPTMDPTILVDEIGAIPGEPDLVAAIEAGRGLILVLPHSGNWDIAGVWLTRKHAPLTSVAERLKPEALYRRFVEYRESIGFEILPDKGGPAPYPILKQRLEEGKVLCLVGDRDLSKHGVPVTFFGEPTRFPAGPAKLAVETGAPIMVAHSWFTPDGGWGLSVTPIESAGADVATITQRVADVFASNIAANPADWHMLQPLWESDWSTERRERLAARE